MSAVLFPITPDPADYAIDTAGVRSLGIEQWASSFYMPVTGAEFQQDYRRIMSLFLTHFVNERSQADTIRWFGLSNLKLIQETAMIVFQTKRLVRLNQNGVKRTLSATPQPLSEHLPQSSFSGRYFTETLFPSRPESLLPSIKLHVRQIVRAAVPEKFDAMLLGNINLPIPRQFIADHGLRTRHLAGQIPLFSYQKQKYAGETPISQYLGKYLNDLSEAFPSLNESCLALLKRTFIDVSKTFEIVFPQYQKFIRTVRAEQLVSTGLGTPRHRIFAAAWRSLDREVIGSTHGNIYATAYDSQSITDGLSLAHRMLTGSQGEARLYRETAEKCSMGLDMAAIEPLRQSIYAPIESKAGEHVKKIMVVGFPMNNHMFASFPAHSSLPRLHLEYRLVRFLAGSGFTPVYKGHPDRLDEIRGLFPSDLISQENILGGYLEKQLDAADCFLFPYSRSSAFGWLMLTNRPMVLLNTPDIMWVGPELEAIAKRVAIVDCDVDDQGRIVYDEGSLLNAIDRSTTMTDPAVLKDFFE